jgi:hypothetical protein
MKNQVLLTLVNGLIIPVLFSLALSTGSRHIRERSGSPNPVKYDRSLVIPLPVEEFNESLSGHDEIMDLMILRNKQINFWIP